MKLSLFTRLRSSSSARVAITLIFFINGFVFSNWVPRIPVLQQQLGLSTGLLGLALWGIAIGALVSQSLAGWLVTRYSSRAVLCVAVLLYCVAFPLPAFAVNLATLMLTLFTLGFTNGLLDVAMNVQGVVVEQREGHPIFASFHAAFSGGGLLGSVCGGWLASLGVAPLFHFCLVTAVTLGAALYAIRSVLPGRIDTKGGEDVPSSNLLLACSCLVSSPSVRSWEREPSPTGAQCTSREPCIRV